MASLAADLREMQDVQALIEVFADHADACILYYALSTFVTYVHGELERLIVTCMND